MNIFLDKIKEIALPNKYTNWYCNIIEKAFLRPQNRNTLKETIGYVECHHIFPKSFRLEFKKHKDNLIFLTSREHFIIHKLLTKMFVGIFNSKMSYAFKFFYNSRVNPNVYFNSKLYNKSKLNLECSEETKKRISASNLGKISAMRGKRHSQESNQKNRLSHLNKYNGELNPFFGKHHSKESNEKNRLSHLGKMSGEKSYWFGKHGKDHPKSRSIQQIDKNTGETIKIWDSIALAQKELNISGVCLVCQGVRKSAGGFKWEYAQ